jgi:hypothetical protein
LNHGAEDVGVDLLPVEIADVEEIGPGYLTEARDGEALTPSPSPKLGEGSRSIFMSPFSRLGRRG